MRDDGQVVPAWLGSAGEAKAQWLHLGSKSKEEKAPHSRPPFHSRVTVTTDGNCAQEPDSLMRVIFNLGGSKRGHRQTHKVQVPEDT